LVESFGEAAGGGRGVLAGKHLDNSLGGAEEFHGSAADVGAVAVLFGAVQVAVVAEVNHPGIISIRRTDRQGKIVDRDAIMARS
jgi:hypothetical protein